jgi:hypothetical protein
MEEANQFKRRKKAWAGKKDVGILSSSKGYRSEPVWPLSYRGAFTSRFSGRLSTGFSVGCTWFIIFLQGDGVRYVSEVNWKLKRWVKRPYLMILPSVKGDLESIRSLRSVKIEKWPKFAE